MSPAVLKALGHVQRLSAWGRVLWFRVLQSRASGRHRRIVAPPELYTLATRRDVGVAFTIVRLQVPLRRPGFDLLDSLDRQPMDPLELVEDCGRTLVSVERALLWLEAVHLVTRDGWDLWAITPTGKAALARDRARSA